MIELRFATASLHRTCCARAERIKVYGTDRATALARRLAQLDAIEVLDDLARLPFDCKPRPDGSFSVSIAGSLHLRLRAVQAREGEIEALEVTDIFEEE